MSKEEKARQEEKDRIIENRKIYRAYRDCFTSLPGKIVLKDIRKSYLVSCADANPFEMARKVGAQEVVLNIEGIIKLAKNTKAMEELFRMPEDDEFVGE